VRQVLDQLQRAAVADTSARPTRARHNLPRLLTSFVGREAEVRAVQQLLTENRLVTLTGVGGIGKTRLGLEVGAALVEHHAEGVWFVDLAPLVDPALVAQVVVSALGVRLPHDRSPIEGLAEAISSWRALLVLDNCEHLVEACAELADGLLRVCAGLRVLATSREALRVPGEVVWQVASLPLPDTGRACVADEVLRSAAVRLFAERASAAAPGFVLTDVSAAPVAEICGRLDGIPLAIELAASRVRLLGLEQLQKRLDDRLSLLSGGARTQPQRQQTLRATLDWSYALLGASERAVLRGLSVFAGGFTLDAAEAVCGVQSGDQHGVQDVLSALGGLVDKSLVQVDGDERRTRYRLLETVRQYAAEQLAAAGETKMIAGRHRDWYVNWAEQVVPELTRADQVDWYGRLAMELDNFRAADAVSRDPDGAAAGLRLAGALGRYWQVRAPGSEAREWLERALARGPTTPSVARARALTWCGELECQHDDATVGRSRIAEAVTVAREVGDLSLLSMTLRRQALYAGDYTTGPAWLEEAASIARAAGDSRELAMALSYLGAVREQQGKEVEADALNTEALENARASGDANALIDVLINLGGLAARRGQYEAALMHLNECLTNSVAIGYDMYTSLAHRRLAQLALGQGDFTRARSHARASLRLAGGMGRNALGLWPLLMAAILAARQSQYGRAVRMVAALSVWRERHGLAGDRTLWTKVLPKQEPEHVLQMASAVLGDAAAASAWAEGSTLSLEAAMEDALADEDPIVPADAPSAQTGATKTTATPRPSPAGITARERQVAELVGRGFTNRQIAERLVITEGTAKVHVGRVLAKLEFHSRAQLAAWVVQHGLIEPVRVVTLNETVDSAESTANSVLSPVGRASQTPSRVRR
jgi:non-specific serine/threonine protein kinase